ncbi:MAG: 3-carboxy-cis,cis-muconate cycloisomerase [Rhodobacteraceae bacterium]|nr:3-carboxy-cis,cis-muconate cycloisomerase [Paracoccaceae bacterium]
MTDGSNEEALYTGLFADDEIASLFGARAQVRTAVAFETALTAALHATGRIGADAKAEALARLSEYTPDFAALEQGGLHDVVFVPAFVRALREGMAAPEAIHTGATSQDVIDTGLVIILISINEIVQRRGHHMLKALEALVDRIGTARMMAHTRMQPAIAIDARHRVGSWATMSEEMLASMNVAANDAALLQLGGAVGDRAAFGDDASAIAAHMADELGLRDPGRAWHTDRQTVVRFASALAVLSGGLGKIGQDVALMAQAGPEVLRLDGGGGSSAMPHKKNPVKAEVLVALARVTAGQVGTMTGAIVHEQERSGAAWMVEWMVLPQMAQATGRGLTLAAELIGQIEAVGQADAPST